MKIASSFFLSFLVLFSSSAEGQNEKSAHQYCKEQGHKVGTLAFESCCERRENCCDCREKNKKESHQSARRILGRDVGGKFDRSRIKEEELVIVPRGDI